MPLNDHSLLPFTLPVAASAFLPVEVRNNDNLLRRKFVAHQADPVSHVQSGLLAARPAAPAVGSLYISTNVGTETSSIYTSLGWVTLGGGGGGTGAVGLESVFLLMGA